MAVKIFIVLQLILNLVFSDDKLHSPIWFYPASDAWPESCNGKRQSPIDIKDFDIELSQSESFQFYNYEKSLVAKIQNNGHTIQIDVNPTDDIFVTGGNLKGKYKLLQIHFHWQSEHTLNGKRYPLEVHFVHKRSDIVNRNNDVLEDVHLHVLSGLFYINKNDNKKLMDVFDSIHTVLEVGSINKANFIPRYFLPRDVDEYFGYDGSLTVPNCNENVRWTVFYSKIPISNQQYEIFKRTETFNGSFTMNYRNTQPLNNRSLKLFYAKSASSNIFISWSYVFSIMIILYFDRY